MVLFIRNMACESCKILVFDILEKMGMDPFKIELGIVETKKELDAGDLKYFGNAIKRAGLELVKSRKGILADMIKNAVIEYINNTERVGIKFSDYLSQKLNYDYSYLSSYFSGLQGMTVEQFMISVKIEKAKEMLIVDNLTLSQIADKLHYSSVAHLSYQFKKVTGVPASHFKKIQLKNRQTIQKI